MQNLSHIRSPNNFLLPIGKTGLLEGFLKVFFVCKHWQIKRRLLDGFDTEDLLRDDARKLI